MSTPKDEDIKIDGKKEAAELLGALDEESRNRILTGIAKVDPELADTLRKNLFRFEQVLALEPLELQKVIQAYPQRLFALAIRTLGSEEKKTFFSKLSSRQGTLLQEEMDTMGPQKVSDVKAAQAKITDKARELHEQKEIHLK